MSMWLNLAKISPAVLTELRARPELVHNLFFDAEDGAELPVPSGFDPDGDTFGTDYRTYSAIYQAMAEEAGKPDAFDDGETWYAKAAHGVGEDIAYEFCYGPAFILTPEQVAEIAAGMEREDGEVSAAIAAEDEDDEDPELAEMYAEMATDDGDDEDEDDEDIQLFYATAAKEGKAIVGGVS